MSTPQAEREITAELVIERYGSRRNLAEGVAAYAALRASGDMPWQAKDKLGISEPTKIKYERYMAALRAELGMPELPMMRPAPPGWTSERKAKGGVSGAHQTHHVLRGVTSPGCPLCSGGAL